MASHQTYVTDLTLRDAHQCLIATRLRTKDMLPICKKMDQVGFWAMEVWGGATFDSCLRFLNEDPWARLKALRKALPNTRLTMLLRGQNILGYRHYADDVVRAFIQRSAKHGVDVFRVFDALNDIRNLETSIDEIKKQKRHAQGAICYTTSPVHTLEHFVETGKAFKGLGCDSIAIKDMAGLLTPSATVDLYNALHEATKLPIHIHSHATSGLASICHYEAVMAGCRHIDTAISSFSGGASHPPTESIVAALKDTPQDTGLDLSLLLEIADYFKAIRKHYAEFEGEAAEIDPRVQGYQVPGGMISNLHHQLKEQDALDKLPDVQDEIIRVRKDLGYPPLVTPTSQLVGAQAVLNVLSGERYKNITNEVKLYCQGKYGKPPGPINETLQRKAIGRTPLVEGRPADALKPELKKLERETKNIVNTQEDLLSYALFPEVAKSYFDCRDKGECEIDTPEVASGSSGSLNTAQASAFDISLHGERYHIDLMGSGQPSDNEQLLYLWVDGMPEEVLVHDVKLKHIQTASEAPSTVKAPSDNDVMVSMPGTVIKINVKKGEKVKKGQVLMVLEAMKMQTELTAKHAGTVTEIGCKVGDKVTADKPVMQLEPAK